MPGTDAMARYNPVRLPTWIHLGGETLTMDGAMQTATIPSRATIVEIDAETAEVYYAINGLAVDATAHGFVPTNGARIIGPLGNLNSLTLWGTAADAAVAHILYFREG